MKIIMRTLKCCPYFIEAKTGEEVSAGNSWRAEARISHSGVRVGPHSASYGQSSVLMLKVDLHSRGNTNFAQSPQDTAVPIRMAARNKDRAFHQDYIVRQRYSNALPPPPGAPKLLDIPNPGLDYYTSPAFASRMGRQEPLNIEADAFLGMTINLVGMPGIFDGDESCCCPAVYTVFDYSTNPVI